MGITVSREQTTLAKKRTADLPVEIFYQDYRQLTGDFDAIASLGMFEHVGVKNYGTYFSVIKRCLRPGGLFLLQTVGKNAPSQMVEPWISKYIFPNSMLPSPRQISSAAEGRLVLEDWQNFGADYDPTLLAWHQNFVSRWEGLAAKYGARFYRMWRYFLLASAAAFRSRVLQLWQIIFSGTGLVGGYHSIR